jgi:hypothetical protein
MKKTITRLMMLAAAGLALTSQAQNTETFEGFTPGPNGYYEDQTGADWQDAQSVFRYDWDQSFGYWSAGFAYTTLADTGHGDFNHIYNCAAKKGYNNSNTYATGQGGAIITIKNTLTGVDGFYVTNTTYAYMSMKNGDSFAKKFGGTSGNDPDWFKLIVRPYKGGTLSTTDSVEFYLADFRFSNNTQDYILQNWQWVDCSSLNAVDSVLFELKSSDMGSFGMNTPNYFSIDNFTTDVATGINELANAPSLKLYPNPANNTLNLQYTNAQGGASALRIYNIMGMEVFSETHDNAIGMNRQVIDITRLDAGVYFLEISSGGKTQTIKFVKQ